MWEESEARQHTVVSCSSHDCNSFKWRYAIVETGMPRLSSWKFLLSMAAELIHLYFGCFFSTPGIKGSRRNGRFFCVIVIISKIVTFYWVFDNVLWCKTCFYDAPWQVTFTARSRNLSFNALPPRFNLFNRLTVT